MGVVCMSPIPTALVPTKTNFPLRCSPEILPLKRSAAEIVSKAPAYFRYLIHRHPETSTGIVVFPKRRERERESVPFRVTWPTPAACMSVARARLGYGFPWYFTKRGHRLTRPSSSVIALTNPECITVLLRGSISHTTDSATMS